MMNISTHSDFSETINNRYDIYEYRHAGTIFKNDYQQEYKQLTDLLETFLVTYEDIQTPGGGKSPIATKFDNALYGSGWQEKNGISAFV